MAGDLVERLNEIGAHYSACDRQQTIYEAATELARLRTALASADAEGYRRGVEDAAKVADGVKTFEWRGGDDWAAGFFHGKKATAAAIRSLTEPDAEGA